MKLQLDHLPSLRKNDLLRASNVLSEAFYHDPLWNKVFEGIPDFNKRFKTFFLTPLRFCMKYGKVFVSSGQIEGVAGVVPGKWADMNLWRIVRSGALYSVMKMGNTVAKRMAPLNNVLPRDRNLHMGNRAFMYLLILGVAPSYQKKGVGKKLLTNLAEYCDRKGLPIYLETETEENVRMYEYFGYTMLKKIVIDGLGVPMWEMVREPHAVSGSSVKKDIGCNTL